MSDLAVTVAESVDETQFDPGHGYTMSHSLAGAASRTGPSLLIVISMRPQGSTTIRADSNPSRLRAFKIEVKYLWQIGNFERAKATTFEKPDYLRLVGRWLLGKVGHGTNPKASPHKWLDHPGLSR
jgi:hypothetical protein